jgi:hypothetical protein
MFVGGLRDAQQRARGRTAAFAWGRALLLASFAGAAVLGCGPVVALEVEGSGGVADAEEMSPEQLREAWVGTYTVGYDPAQVEGQQHVQYEFRADGTAVKRAVRCSGIFDPLADATWRVGEAGRIEVFADFDDGLSYYFVPGEFPCGAHQFYASSVTADSEAAVAGSYCPSETHSDLSDPCEMVACDEPAQRCIDVFRE